jgi:hypothetical protein
MVKNIILSVLFLTFSYSYSDANKCEEIKKTYQEAKFIEKKFNDYRNALILLQYSSFKNIFYYDKPSCMSEKEFVNYLNGYAYFLSKSDRDESYNIQRLIKKHPDNYYLYQILGDNYKNYYFKYNRIKYKEEALKNYKIYIELATKVGITINQEILHFVESGGLKKAKNSWGDYLNRDGYIPTNEFKAFYIDTNNPKKVVSTEIVKDISINYSYKNFLNIDSHKFAGYWVGYLEFTKDEEKTFYIDQSRSKTRVIVDGYVLYEGNYRVEVNYDFKKGKHKVEIEFMNDWHTTDLFVKILPKIEKFTKKEIKEKLSYLKNRDYELWYVGVYESKNSDHSIDLTILPSNKPLVLLISSKAATWNIKNPYNTKIEAIVVSGYNIGINITGDIPKDAKVLYSNEYITYGYQLEKKCVCHSGSHFHCSGNNIIDNKNFKYIFGKNPTGFTGQYGAKSLMVPNIVLDDKKYLEFEQNKLKIEKQRNECKNKDKNFNNMFK